MMDNKKPNIDVAVDSEYKKLVLKNRAKLIPIIETIFFCGHRELALIRDNNIGSILKSNTGIPKEF